MTQIKTFSFSLSRTQGELVITRINESVSVWAVVRLFFNLCHIVNHTAPPGLQKGLEVSVGLSDTTV